MKRSFTPILVAVICLAATLLSPASASAAGTPTQHVTMDIEIGIPDTDCGSFTIRHSTLRGTFTKIISYDQNGDIGWVAEHYHVLGLATDLVSGQTLRDDFQENDRFTFVGDDWTMVATSGVLYHIVVPGQGLVIGVSGHLIHTQSGEVIFKAGPDDDVSDFPQDLCQLFSR